MKVAVSIPDATFVATERLAKRLGASRSNLYARALDAFVDSHSDDDITAAINKALDEAGEDDLHAFVREAARQTLSRVEW